MTLQLGNVTFDCDDPTRVATFWAAALGRPVADGASEFFVALTGGTPEGSPTMFFIRVPEGKTVKNRVHLDLTADDRNAEVARLVALGATKVADHDEWGHTWTVLTDVEGNEFCVATPTD
jgi:Glyoxalase-like domain